MTDDRGTTTKTNFTENVLVTAIRSGTDNGAELHILDRDSDVWRPRRWAELFGTAEAVATRLQARQLRDPPEPIAVIGEPTYELIAIVLGAWMAGRPSTIVAGPSRLMSLESWARQADDKMRQLGVSEIFSQGTAAKAMAAQLSDEAVANLIATDSVAAWPLARSTFATTKCRPGAPAVYQGTAGSTGTAKAVELSAAAVLNQIEAVLERQQYSHGNDILFSWLPLYHDLGLTMLLAGMITGAPTWIAPASAFAKAPFAWPNWLDHSQATVTAAPDFAYSLLARYSRVVQGADLSQLRVAINAGEPIDVDAAEQLIANLAKSGFSPAALCCSYGLAEASCGLTMPQASSGFSADEFVVNGATRKSAHLGSALTGVEIRVVPSDRRVEELSEVRAVGEIEFRSTAQMTGYVGEPPVGTDAWIKTGDLGYLAEEQLVVCGRSKELITIAGRNIFPQEVERVASIVTGIRPGGVAVVSGKGRGARRDQLIVVAEYLGDAPSATRQTIVERVSAECGVTPGAVDFVESLPKTTSGKLRRVEIAARYQ
jgi:long-chain-fatty-acid--[acyl-carrier-protein] ligase